MTLDAQGTVSNFHFDEKGRPIDGNRELSNGKTETIHFGLDSKDRIIKRITRREGETISEMNYVYSGENIAAEEGFILRADGTKAIHFAKFQYDTKGLNPYFFDQYIASIALLENVSKNLRTAVINADGKETLTIDYNLDNNLMPTQANFITQGGTFSADYLIECL